MNINGKIYFDKQTGSIILFLPEQRNVLGVVSTTTEQDISSWKVLSERNRDTFDVLELPYGAYAQDFAEGRLIGVNVETKVPIFEYPNPENPDEPLIPEVPFSVEISSLKDENAFLFYDSMMKDSKIADLENMTSVLAFESIMKDKLIATQETAHADLMYTLMMNGVI